NGSLAVATIARWWTIGLVDLRSPPPPGGVGYRGCWLRRGGWLGRFDWLACGSHHRQMVDDWIGRLA
ncbi:MAG: hypothetical protein ACK43N_20680, partial [Pirellulaceae bacterium]